MQLTSALRLNATNISSTSLQFSAPSHAMGNVDVTVTAIGGTSAPLSGGLTYLASPTVSTLSPNAGPTTGTASVIINGENFVQNATKVDFDGQLINPINTTTTALEFAVPAHAAGTVDVAVVTPGGTSALVNGGFTYMALPNLTPVAEPIVVSVNGGTSVTLAGTNLTGVTQMHVDGVGVVPTMSSENSIAFTAPVHAKGSVDVYAVNPGGSSNILRGALLYAEAPIAGALSPISGLPAGGSDVTITGANFIVGNTRVNFDTIQIMATVIDATHLQFTTPAHAIGTVAVSITTPVGTSSPINGGFTYADRPTATAINPQIVPTSGALGVVLTGTNFINGSTSITVDATAVAPYNVSATRLTFDAPAHASGIAAIQVITPSGVSADLGGGLNYQNPPTVGELSPAMGSANGVSNVSLTGANFIAGNTTVYLDGLAVEPSVVDSTSLTFDAPAHMEGTVTVNVQTPAGTSANVNGGFTYQAVPTITSCTYNSALAYLCVGNNMDVFPNTFLSVQGGVHCVAALGVTRLIPTIKNALNLGGTSLAALYAGCSVKLCNTLLCTNLQSNTVVFI